MPQAVRFDQDGGPDVLYVVDVESPEPGKGEVVVRVKAAGINPGEAVIREGLLHERWPGHFPPARAATWPA
ncbi:MAG: NADPH:quinone reductase [Solirubrobacteraceae bacterium]|jgi:NADPH:quinone reductase-like Zn-dependent oxidoreductase|nr:NADPH:quinone reductase [Solirubrobacteraceae bacterium]